MAHIKQKSLPQKPKAVGSVIYGVHAVAAAWLNPERKCLRLRGTEQGLEALRKACEGKQVEARPAPVKVLRQELDEIAPEAVHQGLVLEVAPLPEVSLEDICAQAAASDSALVILLDQVTDPHNVGAVLRSASAFGAKAVVTTERNAPETTGVLAKSASGALEHVPLVRVSNLARALEQLIEAGFWCVGLAEKGERLLSDVKLDGRVALVLGSEGTGLRRLTMEKCHEVVRLPTVGVESLNVSNAAAVAMYEVVRQAKRT